MTTAADIHWAAILTTAGTLMAGLALPIAFVQLGALRRDRLRAQVNKVGAWIDKPEKSLALVRWKVTLHVRNSSELPIIVQMAELFIEPQWSARDEAPNGSPRKIGDPYYTEAPSTTIAPEGTWTASFDYRAFEHKPEPPSERWRPEAPEVSLTRIRLTDAAGIRWEIRPSNPGPAKRIIHGRLRRIWERSSVLGIMETDWSEE